MCFPRNTLVAEIGRNRDADTVGTLVSAGYCGSNNAANIKTFSFWVYIHLLSRKMHLVMHRGCTL